MTTNRAESRSDSRSSAGHERVPGILAPMHPNVLGSIIGMAGGSSFVLANRGQLEGAWPSVALVAWVIALVAAIWIVLLRPRVLPAAAPPRRGAGAVYGCAVLAMIAGIALGRLALDALGHPELQPALVVLAVGLHFLPFTRAFGAPVFARIGLSMAALGVLGLVWGWFAGAGAVAACAVVAGLVLLAGIVAAALDASLYATTPKTDSSPVSRG